MADMHGVDWSCGEPSALLARARVTSGARRRVHSSSNPGRVLFALLAAYVLSGALASLVASRLIWNGTPSLPLGLYLRVERQHPRAHDLVALRVPMNVRPLVHERRYLPDGSLLLKPVAAAAGESVCRRGDELLINGVVFGHVLSEDSAGRPLPSFGGCQVLGEHELFLASHHPRSFDSRTFGPVDDRALKGTVIPLWTF